MEEIVGDLLKDEAYKGLENEVETIFSYNDEGALTIFLSATTSGKNAVEGVRRIEKKTKAEFKFVVKPNPAGDRLYKNITEFSILASDSNENEISEEDIADGGLV